MNQQATGVGEDVKKKQSPRALLVRLQIRPDTMEKNMEVPQKFKNRTTTWHSSPTSGFSSTEIKTLI